MDNTVLAAMIGAAGAIIVALFTWMNARNAKKLNMIHVLVNSRLTAAINEIIELKSTVRSLGVEPPVYKPAPPTAAVKEANLAGAKIEKLMADKATAHKIEQKINQIANEPTPPPVTPEPMTSPSSDVILVPEHDKSVTIKGTVDTVHLVGKDIEVIP